MRSCEVILGKDEVKKATFHMWSEYADTIGASAFQGGHPGGQIKYPVAVVEYTDGTCATVPAHFIRFTDNPRKFKIKKVDDAKLVNKILKDLADNNGFCPCALHNTEDTRCMCKEFREQAVPGKCRCGLYEKVEV